MNSILKSIDRQNTLIDIAVMTISIARIDNILKYHSTLNERSKTLLKAEKIGYQIMIENLERKEAHNET